MFMYRQNIEQLFMKYKYLTVNSYFNWNTQFHHTVRQSTRPLQKVSVGMELKQRFLARRSRVLPITPFYAINYSLTHHILPWSVPKYPVTWLQYSSVYFTFFGSTAFSSKCLLLRIISFLYSNLDIFCVYLCFNKIGKIDHYALL